jgi:transcriptional regulator with XRE-family HTH domain
LQRDNTSYGWSNSTSFLGRILRNPVKAVNPSVDRFLPRNYSQPYVEALRRLIEEWLDAQNGTQADLARASHVPQNVISKWVNGQVDQASPDNLKKIAPTLGLTYEDLLRRMGELPAEAGATYDPIEQAIRASAPLKCARPSAGRPSRCGRSLFARRSTPRSWWRVIWPKWQEPKLVTRQRPHLTNRPSRLTSRNRALGPR